MIYYNIYNIVNNLNIVVVFLVLIHTCGAHMFTLIKDCVLCYIKFDVHYIDLQKWSYFKTVTIDYFCGYFSNLIMCLWTWNETNICKKYNEIYVCIVFISQREWSQT